MFANIRCKLLLQWCDEMGTKIENNAFSNLEDCLSHLQKDSEDEVNSKRILYDEILSIGTTLSDLTRGKEQKEINKTLKNVQTRWNSVLKDLEDRRNRVKNLIEVRGCIHFIELMMKGLFEGDV